jgi:PhnB protein
VLSVYVPDEDAVRARYERALAAGGTSIYEPSQREWSAFAAQVSDPDGHLWMILVQPHDWAD